jgi:hypothetical protein
MCHPAQRARARRRLSIGGDGCLENRGGAVVVRPDGCSPGEAVVDENYGSQDSSDKGGGEEEARCGVNKKAR